MRKASKGFTIVEVLIFLAISGVMFIIAFYGMQSQRDGVSFRQALNNIELKIRETFNNVDNGYFGNVGDYSCAIESGSVVIQSSAGDTGGTSSDCVFLGKTIDFIDDSNMKISTIIGARLIDSLENEEDITETYEINNNVKWLSDRLYNSGTEESSLVPDLKVRAQRDRDAEVTAQSDLRATRSYYTDASGWQNISDQNLPMFCFELGNKKGSVIITQRDITVNYTGEGCE